MNVHVRYILLIFSIIISLHFILSFTHEEYGRATSLSKLTNLGSTNPASSRPSIPEDYFHPPDSDDVGSPFDRRANATFVVLARNGDLQGVVSSLKQMEDRFNKEFQYPWTFLNEEPFSDEFKRRIRELTDAPVEFGLIPHDDWYQPKSIDEERATKSRDAMLAANVIYGGSVPYRNMCRFNSGFFFRHELLQKYRYYWRVEPHVQFFCDIHYDPFLFMQDNNKVYGFTVSLYEYHETIVTLWDTVKDFLSKNPGLTPPDNALKFLSDDDGQTYNRCHFWSNFEIGDLDFWRNDTYMSFFEHLDEAGGFYYERWGDAPVHSIGAALFARKDQIHFFEDIGYRHEPFQHCPQGASHTRGKCWCEKSQNFDYEWYSCLKRYDALF